MAFILYTAAVLLLSIKSTSGICPQNCSCDNEYQLAVNCDDVKLRYLPPLLHPGTQFLRLSKCQIEQLDLDVMELYPDIIHLDLSSNSIPVLGTSVFRYQSKIQFLNLSRNNFSIIFHHDFQGLYRLQYLDLSSNRLQRIESNALEDLGELLELNLSYNLLNNFSFEIFTGLINLQKLRIAGNQITRFDDSPLSKTLPNLRNIDLSQNMITSIPSDTFLGLKLIKAIDLSSNLLKEIPTFDQNNLVNLKYLNMNFNKLREITPHSFRQLLSLLELDLARNEFSVLSASAFDGLFHLKELKLSEQMYLRKIQNGAFSGLASLEVLNLSHSQILEYIDENAFEVSHALRTFDASYCSLKTFPSGLFDWKRVTELRLHGNPLHCDHKLLSFLPDILRLRSIHNVICASPNDLYNISISALDTAEVTPDDTKQVIIVLCFTLTALTVLILLILFLCSKITSISDEAKKSTLSTVDRQIKQNLSTTRKYIVPECYNSINEFTDSSTCNIQNTFVDLFQSENFNGKMPMNAFLINNDIFVKQNDFTYLSIE